MNEGHSLPVPDRQPFAYPVAPFRAPGAEWEAPSGGTPGLDIAGLLRVLREWRWLILAVFAAGIALAVLATVLTTPLYRAFVTLEVNPPTVEIMTDDETSEQRSGVSNWDRVVTQVGLLSSRTLAQRVAQDLNLAADPNVAGTGTAAERLRAATNVVAGGLSVIPPDEGQLIRFSYTSSSPELAARIANGVAEGFINSGLQRRYESSNYARNFLQQQIAKTRADLEKSERQVVAYAQAQGIINTGGGPDSAGSDTNSLEGESLIALNRALAEATARRVQAEGAYRQARLAGSAEASTGTAALRGTKAALEAEYQEKRTLMKPDHPDMLSLRSRIEEIDRQIAREQGQVAGGRASALLAEYRAAAAAESNLRSRVAGLRGSVQNLRGRSIQYNILQRDVDTNRALYDALLQRYKAIGVGGGIGTSPVSIVDRAEVPGGPFKPNLFFNLLVGALGGLAVGVGLALLLEYLNDTIKTREDVKSKLGQACLGVIPRQRTKGAFVDEIEDPASPISEAYSAVLASLRFASEGGAPKAIFVTSAQPSEGKSSTALALAQNYARRGESVLLIDSDLRRPAFKGVNKSHGVTNLLTSDESIRGHVVRTQYDQLWLLPCGPIAPNPADLLSTPRFAAILEEAKQHFDRVVVDGPPVLGLADSALLAAFVGQVMVVVESGRTRTRTARETIERLQAAGAHILGVTLTKSTGEASQYGYGYYRYGSIGDKRKEMIMISQTGEPGDPSSAA